VPVVTVRPFNCYGPRQSPRAFIPTVILQALTRDRVVLGNLEPKRDMTFVGDTVEGFVQAAVAEGIEREVINLGSGTASSIGDLARQIVSIMGSAAVIEQDPARFRPEASEVAHLVAGSAKARRLLGWSPSTEFADGIRATVEFLRRQVDEHDVDRYAI
jgi:nucleoside-diphosphate-sugar epimerase